MGVIELFLGIVLIVFMGWVTVYALDTFTPGHPAQITNIIWFVTVVLVLLLLARGVGLLNYDPPVPRVR